MRCNPLEEFDKRYDPDSPPLMYRLADSQGFVVKMEWNGLDEFLNEHPLPEGEYWAWRCTNESQIRLHRSDDPEYIDRYGLENIQSSAMFGLRRIE